MDIYKYLHEFTYYKEGGLYWLKCPRQGVPKDSIAGKKNTNNKGYRVIMIKGKLWLLHRLIYIYHFKEIKSTIDHIDRNRLNNNIENLRDVSESKNQENRGMQINNTSGFFGVSLDKRRNTWNAEIKRDGKRIRKSGFTTKMEAAEYLLKFSENLSINIIEEVTSGG